MTKWNGVVIAAQCCTEYTTDKKRDTATCKRWHQTHDDKGCIAGHALHGGVRQMTYSDAFEACTTKGLVMCGQSCSGKGCYYNNYPVFTGIECELP